MLRIVHITEDLVAQAPGKVFIIVIPLFAIAVIPIVLELAQIFFNIALRDALAVGQFIVRG